MYVYKYIYMHACMQQRFVVPFMPIFSTSSVMLTSGL